MNLKYARPALLTFKCDRPWAFWPHHLCPIYKNKRKMTRAKSSWGFFFVRLGIAIFLTRAAVKNGGITKWSNRDFKIRYGDVLLRLREVKITPGDVSTRVAVQLLFLGRKVSRCCGCPLCCYFWVGASHRVNLMHLSPLDRNVQEKIAMSISTTAKYLLRRTLRYVSKNFHFLAIFMLISVFFLFSEVESRYLAIELYLDIT